MDWTEVTVSVNTEQLELVTAICNMVVSHGIYIEDYSDLEEGAREIAHIDLIDEDLLLKNRNKALVHIYISNEYNAEESVQYITERLKAEKIPHEIVSNGVNDADWADSWKKFFKVTPIGERLVICPEWEHYENTDNKVVLKIDPGAAFGTGTHATTSLCLEILQKYIKKSDRVLDVGSGSGILSIAAVLLGAECAVGVDIDATAVKVAGENAALNSVSNKTNYTCGDLAEKINDKYNIVCANIVADIIMRLNLNIKDYMEKDAVYITSGIIDVRADEVKQSFLNNNLTILEEVRRDNWYAFALKCSEEADA